MMILMINDDELMTIETALNALEQQYLDNMSRWANAGKRRAHNYNAARARVDKIRALRRVLPQPEKIA